MKPNFDQKIDVPEGYVYVFGYDLVNGTKCDFTSHPVMLKKNELPDFVKDIKAENNGKDVMIYKKERL